MNARSVFFIKVKIAKNSQKKSVYAYIRSMKPFLEQVANHYFLEDEFERICFIFPNRRSMAFFSKYLRENIADRSMHAFGCAEPRPMMMPLTLTINDFFYRAHGVETEDRVTLLLELYECYRQVNPGAETLDEFISWGEVILGDFSDVDKYLADPHQVFTNVREFKEIQDDYSHLSPAQRQALDEFISHFRDKNGLKPNAKGDNVKSRFLMIWDMLLPLYLKYNEHLRSRNMAYDGMVYRGLAEKIASIPASDFFREAYPRCVKFVFVGLNALNESEKAVLRKMNNAGIAEFCWDYTSDMLRDGRNRSSYNMKENTAEFVQKWKLDPEGLADPEINVLSVPSSVGQAKQLPGILAETMGLRNPGCTDCAIVLPDESLLMSVLNSIPEEVGDINVTMGYPMASSGIWSLMEDVSSMQLHLRRKGDEWYFYHRQVRSILSSGVFMKALDDQGREIAARICRDAKYYIPQSDFSGNPLMELLFRPVVEKPREADAGQIHAFEDYQMEFITALAPRLLESADSASEIEFARRYCSCINLLRGKDLSVLPVTYVRLLSQLACGESVPFEGEPLKGLQIMGPLETRALDFRNVIILSCNEGIFPKRNASVSFIPPELRKGFGLPTNEFKDAVLAYSFYRLIQRAEKVWLVFDSRMEKMKAGEESRYIKQLEYHFRKPLRRYIAKNEMSPGGAPSPIEKPSDIAEIVRKKSLSVSSIQNYLKCPAMFYYSSICNLRPEREISDSMDASMLGNVYHSVMQALYLGDAAMAPDFSLDRDSIKQSVRSGVLVPLTEVTDAYLTRWIKDRPAIKARVRSLIKEELHTLDVTGRDLVTEEVILQYVVKTLERDREHLRSKGLGSFKVIGLELPVAWSCDGYSFFGYIDRVDSFGDGTVRIVDYKTGKVEDKDINITDANAEKVAEALFKPDNDSRPKIALQLFLYGKYVEGESWMKGREMVNVIYPAATLFTTPVAELEKPRSARFGEIVLEKLRETLAELADPSTEFRRTSSIKTCGMCDFRNICGR